MIAVSSAPNVIALQMATIHSVRVRDTVATIAHELHVAETSHGVASIAAALVGSVGLLNYPSDLSCASSVRASWCTCAGRR